jgi:hypothetical protein
MAEQPEENLPHVPFGISELYGIALVLWGYSQYVKSAPQALSHAEPAPNLIGLSKRLTTALALSDNELYIPLTAQELQTLVTALQDFCSAVTDHIPESKERESILAAVTEWQVRLKAILAEFTQS